MSAAQRSKVQVTTVWAAVAALVLVIAGSVVVWALRTGPEAGSEVGPDPVVVSQYDGDYTVSAEGDLLAVETIDATFPEGRHGIYRFWDAVDPENAAARYPVTVLSVTRDGQAEPIAVWLTGTSTVARVGDPGVLLPAGTHRYVLRWTVPDVLRPVRDVPTDGARTDGERTGVERSVLAWWVVPPAWELPVLAAHATVRMPVPVTEGLCRRPDDGTCTVEGAGTTTLTVTAGDLGPRTGVEVAAYSSAPPASAPPVPWGARWDPYLGTDASPVLVCLLLTALAAAAGAALVVRTRERPPTSPPTYAPPSGLGPVQCQYLVTETTGRDALTATVLHLAERGRVVLEDHELGRWTVRAAATGALRQLDPVSESVVDALGLRQAGHAFETWHLATSGTTVAATVRSLEAAVERWATTGMWRPDRVAQATRVSVVVSLVVAVLLGASETPVLAGLPFAAFAVAAAPIFVNGRARRRTPEAHEAWQQATAFRRALSASSSTDGLGAPVRDDVWSAAVPYAVAFGCSDAWAERYRLSVGHEPPRPSWYVSPRPCSWCSTGVPGSFDSAIATSVAVATAQAHASGGQSGGGFGGGGFGGGGSW